MYQANMYHTMSLLGIALLCRPAVLSDSAHVDAAPCLVFLLALCIPRARHPQPQRSRLADQPAYRVVTRLAPR